MDAYRYEHHARNWAARLAVLAAMSGLAWGVPASARASSPTVSTDGASATGPTLATVDGNGDPEGQSTTLHADYALAGELWCTSNGKQGTPAETLPQTLGSGNEMLSEIPVKLEGLIPGREYCVELVAHSDSGTAYGGQVRFATPTPPLIESETVSEITEHDAVLQAQVDPEAQPVRYQFQIDKDPSEYLPEMVCPTTPSPGLCLASPVTGALPIGFIKSGSQGQSVSLDLASIGMTLQPGATYHYRLIAARSVQTEDTIQWEGPPVYGLDQTFTTSSRPPVASDETSGLGMQAGLGGSSAAPGEMSHDSLPGKTFKPKALARLQKLSKALKECKKKPKSRRAACAKQARKRYGPAKKKA